MNLINAVVGFFKPKPKVKMARDASPEDWAQLFKDLRSDGFTDEDYKKYYGDDQEAIRKAKESWARAGEEVIEGIKRDMGYDGKIRDRCYGDGSGYGED